MRGEPLDQPTLDDALQVVLDRQRQTCCAQRRTRGEDDSVACATPQGRCSGAARFAPATQPLPIRLVVVPEYADRAPIRVPRRARLYV